MPSQRRAIYPGSFDPLTTGHADVVERAARLFDEVIVAVARNSGKSPLFSTAERVALITEAFAPHPNVRVETFEGLLVDYARASNATALIRGLRAVTDFEYEFQMALMNRHLAPEIETVFLMTDAGKAFVSSTLVKEVARLGGDFHGLVPPVVERALRARLAEEANTEHGKGGD